MTKLSQLQSINNRIERAGEAADKMVPKCFAVYSLVVGMVFACYLWLSERIYIPSMQTWCLLVM